MLAPGALVITPGDRADILLGAFVANRSAGARSLAGILLTGGLAPAVEINGLITGLSDESLPVLAVEEDTYVTATGVHDVRGAIAPDDDRKVARALGLFEAFVPVPELESRVQLTRASRITPLMFEYELVRRAAQERKRIVLPEGSEERILRAADILLRRRAVDLVLLGEEAVIRRRISALALDLEGVTIIDPSRAECLEDYAREYYRLRRHRGVTPDRATDAMRDPIYFGTMMVYQG